MRLIAGVGVLLSTKITGQPVIVEVMRGCILRLDVTLGDKMFSFFNVYAPDVGCERVCFLSNCLRHWRPLG